MSFSKNQLKPCPFCGCDRSQISSDGGCKHFRVFCPDCRAIVGNDLWGEESKTAAIAAWNKRTGAAIQPVEATKLYDRIVEAEAHLSKLCETGGRSWSLSIPVRQYDSDMVYSDMMAAAKELLALKRLPVRESGVDAKLAAAIMRVNDMRHADNATGNSFVPDRTDKAIDALVDAGNLILERLQMRTDIEDQAGGK